MLAEWAAPALITKDLTVDDMTRRLQKLFPGKYPNGFLWTWIDDSVTLLNSYGIKSKTFSGISIAQLAAYTDKNPALVLIDYTQMPNRLKFDLSYRNGHAICIWKVSGNTIDFSDPYGRTEEYGRHTMTVSEFAKCWGSTTYYKNPNQGIRLL